VRLFGVCFLLAVLAATLGAQSIRPQPFGRFIPGTAAQDIAATPKGGWTYIVGSTTDPNYPVTPDAFDRTCGTDGDCNVFQGRFGPLRLADVVLTVFDAAGEIQYSTFLGGSGQDDNPRLALAPDGTLWLAGNKASVGFEKGPAGCNGSLWVARFEYTLQRIDQFLCFGDATVADIALDSDGTLWVLGTTGSPVLTVNAFQPTLAGQLDMFLGHISPSASAPLMATLIGGDRLDLATKLAITPAGDIAIVGSTDSTNFPLVRPLRPAPPGRFNDAVILVMDRSGRFLEFSTLWGGVFNDTAQGVAVAASGNLFVTGQTASADMPTTAGAFDTQCDNDGACRGWDAFVVKVNNVGELVASTFYGGSGLESGREIIVRPNGQVIAMGFTQSADFPLVGAQLFQRWKPAVNFEHTWVATFDDRLERVTRSVFVGSEDVLPSGRELVDRNGLVYVAGQVTPNHGAPAFGNYLTAQPIP